MLGLEFIIVVYLWVLVRLICFTLGDLYLVYTSCCSLGLVLGSCGGVVDCVTLGGLGLWVGLFCVLYLCALNIGSDGVLIMRIVAGLR